MAIIKLSAIERRRLSTFITCLVLAVVAWVFTALSKNYNYPVKEVLAFKNGPQKRAFHSLQSDTVDVTVQGSGWQMLFSKMSTENKTITIDLRTLENKNFVVLSNQLKQINQHKELDRQIIAISPDTLYFDFTNRMIKKVPVKLLLGINYQQRFVLSNPIQINPPYVMVSGPANRVDKIEQWPTDSLIVKNVNEKVSQRLRLKAINDGSLVIYPKIVEVKIPVDEFTEKTLEIPVKLINHHYYNVKIFPQKVKLTFMVSLNKYAETDDQFFEAAADLDL